MVEATTEGCSCFDRFYSGAQKKYDLSMLINQGLMCKVHSLSCIQPQQKTKVDVAQSTQRSENRGSMEVWYLISFDSPEN